MKRQSRRMGGAKRYPSMPGVESDGFRFALPILRWTDISGSSLRAQGMNPAQLDASSRWPGPNDGSRRAIAGPISLFGNQPNRDAREPPYSPPRRQDNSSGKPAVPDRTVRAKLAMGPLPVRRLPACHHRSRKVGSCGRVSGALLRVRCHQSKGSSADVPSAYQSPNLRSAGRAVEGVAQRPFPRGNSQKTLVPPGYPISFIIETKRTIKRRLIHTLHSVGSIIPRFGIVIRAAASDRMSHSRSASVHARTAPYLYVSGLSFRTSKSC